jgi:hypothetical protein
MPQPEIHQVHQVDVPLTNVSIRYRQSDEVFIADKVFPVIPVSHLSDSFYKYDREQWYRSDAQLRAPGTESAGTGFSMSLDTYRCDVFAVHKDIDDQTRANADSQINLDVDAAELVTRHLLIKKEQDWINTFFANSVWGTSTTPSNLWSDYGASDPIGDIETATLTMLENTGYRPNTLIMGPQVWSKLKNHPDYLDRIKYVQKGIVGTDLLSSLIDGNPRVMVPVGIKNTAVEPLAGSYDFFYGKHALLLYVEPSLTLNGVSAGATFSWTGYSPGGVSMRRFRMENIRSERIEGEMHYDHKIIATDLGYFFNGAVA